MLRRPDIETDHPLRKLFRSALEYGFKLNPTDKKEIADYIEEQILCEFIHFDTIYKIRDLEGNIAEVMSSCSRPSVQSGNPCSSSSTLPSTLAGGILGLLIAGQTINVSSTIGLIALFGVCAQNDIILAAKINDLRKKGMSAREAVIEGSMIKFRPIFITDIVMIVGVLPMALAVTTGAELHRPLAVVYIGGFLFAALLRRFIVPLLYDTFAGVEEWFRRRRMPCK